MDTIDKIIGAGLIVSLICIVLLVISVTITGATTSVSGQSYQKGNNTVANVTAIIDLNDETLADSPIRLVNPHGEMQFHEVDWDCRLYGECDIWDPTLDECLDLGMDNEFDEQTCRKEMVKDSSRIVAIECPTNFTEDTMHLYYRCNN